MTFQQLTAKYAALPPLQQGRGRGVPEARGRGSIIPLPVSSTAAIPEVRLPDGWDAPLENPIPVVPLLPVQQIRGRPRNRQEGNSRLVDQPQILGNQPGLVDPHQPLNVEAIREAARRRDEQWVAQMSLHRAREQHEAAQSITPTEQIEEQNRLENQSRWVDPRQPLNIEAMKEAAKRRDEQWMRQMHNIWRNEEAAEQQAQQDEEEEWRQAVANHNSLTDRMNRSEEIVNYTSHHQLANYQIQIQMAADYWPAPQLLHPPSPPPPPPSPPPALQPPLLPPAQIHHFQQAYWPAPQQIQQNIPKARAPYHDPPQHFSLGPMNLECSECHALHFKAEKLSNSTCDQINFGLCCLSGQIKLPEFPPAPRALRDLFDGTSPHSQNFKTNI